MSLDCEVRTVEIFTWDRDTDRVVDMNIFNLQKIHRFVSLDCGDK